MRSFTSLDYVIAGALGSIIWLYKLGKNCEITNVRRSGQWGWPGPLACHFERWIKAITVLPDADRLTARAALLPALSSASTWALRSQGPPTDRLPAVVQ